MSSSSPLPVGRRRSYRLSWSSLSGMLPLSPISVSEFPLASTILTQSPSSTPPSAWSHSSSFSSRRTSTSSLTPDPQIKSASTPSLPRTVSANGTTATSSNSTSNGNNANHHGGTAREKTGSFGRGAFFTMMDNLSSFSIHRDRDRDDRRGRSASQARPSTSDGTHADGRERETRSTSPFFHRRRASTSNSTNTATATTAVAGPTVTPTTTTSQYRRDRDASPSVEALAYSDFESDTDSLASSKRGAPRNSAFHLDESEDEDGFDSESSWGSSDDKFDDLTEFNTERNAQTIPPIAGTLLDEYEPDNDPLGEGVNVVVPPEPLFPTTLHGTHHQRETLSSGSTGAVGAGGGAGGGGGGGGGARRSTTLSRRRTLKLEHHLPLTTSRPIFQRDRCTIKLTNGDPIKTIKEECRTPRRYVVASDLSVESRYAVEWCVGTVMRDGDEMVLVTVAETEGKLDPPEGTTIDRVNKLRNQQERQTLAYLLVRQVTTLLQRTRLNVSVVCQAWHAKNSRYLLLDLIDYVEPTMLIVGSRGLSKLKGILLGSFSHYLIQKSSVPVMVARRRLKRPPRKSAHLSSHRAARVPLSKAAIDKAPSSKVVDDVEAMRDEMMKGGEEESRGKFDLLEREEDEVDPEAEGGVPTGVGVGRVGSPSTSTISSSVSPPGGTSVHVGSPI